MEHWKLSLAEQVAAVRSGRVTVEALATEYLERIEALDGQLGAYLLVDREGALAQARALDSALSAGADPGPLTGVCVGLKDIFVTEGLETTCGSKILEGFRPPYESAVAARLKQAGAVILGKLNMDEFAMGSSNEHSAYRVCKNPWDLDRVPGGSSGGSAAAVAAGLCALAMGTDTGGSIRQPAAFCGVSGIKPTYGRVSRHGLVAFASSLDQAGPLGRSARDCAAALEVLSGRDPKDATSLPHPVGAYVEACSAGLQGMTIGVPEEYFAEGLDPEVEAAVRSAIAELEAAGAKVRSVHLPHTKYAVAAYYIISPAEASSNLARYDGVRYGHRTERAGNLEEMYRRSRGEGFGPEVKRRIMLGTYVLSAGYYDAYYGRAQRVRTLIRRDFEQAFSSCDVIATPTSPVAAFGLGELVTDPLEMYLADAYTISCNLAGLPGMSIPCGQTSEGLPVGLQLLGPTLGEEAIFRVAGAYQERTDWHQTWPAFAMEAAR